MGPQIPTAGGRAVLCDCGANAECTPEYLLQFAYLCSYYAQRVMGIEKPRVGLLNIGAEEEKGDTLRHETYALLKEAGEAGRIHFIGNVEANEAMMGTADVGITNDLFHRYDAENHGGRRQVPAQVPEGDVPLQHQDQATPVCEKDLGR